MSTYASSSCTTLSTSTPNIDDVNANNSPSNPDPFKYSHGLTGVDQPANYFYVNVLVATIIGLTSVLICLRAFVAYQQYQRRLSVVTAPESHGLWTKNRYLWWAWMKRHALYAPIWSKRRSHEMRISKIIRMGTLPTRLQLIILVIYIASNIAYCLAIPQQPPVQRLTEFRGRCGVLAVFNMILTILFALRSNPFIWLLSISYDTFNLFHRWAARIVFVQTVAHVSAWLYNTYRVDYDGLKGWSSIHWVLTQSLSYRWGLAAFVTFSFIMVQSLRPLRQAFYESFLTLHRLSVIVAISGIYFHLAQHALPQLPWCYLFIAFLIVEYVLRAGRIFYYNSSLTRMTWTQVTVEVLPGQASKVTMELPRAWTQKPGIYVHLYLPRLAFWSSHPFSVAWSKETSPVTTEKETSPEVTEDRAIERSASTISFVIRAHSGMTRALYDRASSTKSKKLQLWSAIEGPYGGHHSLSSYSTVLLFAAGAGITHQISYIRYLLAGHNDNTVAAKKIILVWSIQSIDMLEWVQAWLDELVAMPSFQQVVRIRLHVSQVDMTGSEARSLPTGVDVRNGRCDPQEVVDEEIESQVGAMAVTVCGPGGFNDSVRAAVRCRVALKSIDFIEESFTY